MGLLGRRSFRFFRRAFGAAGYQLREHVEDPALDGDERFRALLETCRPYTMTSVERLYALYQGVQYVVKAGIPGEFVECGVWRGGSAMLIARTLKELGVTDRRIVMYDTFEGMPAPSAADNDFRGRSAQALMQSGAGADGGDVRCYADLPDVTRNMTATEYPTSQMAFVKGKVEETITGAVSAKIALLRLDTDWYESTRHELQHLYPLLHPGGVLIVDDYGHWQGCKQAVDEYFADKPLLLSRIDYTGRIGVKP